MSVPSPLFRNAKLVTSKLGSLVLLLQKSPLVQWIVPEARMAGTAGVCELTKWSVATVAGLGLFDSVTGATTLTQLSPSPGSTSVSATSGTSVSFTVQLTGTPYIKEINRWTTLGTMPAGLTGAQNPIDPTLFTISGIPTQTGTFPISIFAIGATIAENSYSSSFTIRVDPAVVPTPTIAKQPRSVTIARGGRATLKVVATGSNLTYQWYQGVSGNKAKRVRGARSATFTTPPLKANTSYWVEVRSPAGGVNSKTATVRLR